jgi:glycine dehydrogenase
MIGLNPLENLQEFKMFPKRHIGPRSEDLNSMLGTLGLKSIHDLTEKAIPKGLLLQGNLDLPEPRTEPQLLSRARELANKNTVAKSYIGMGYYGCFTPTVILRNILENPLWYTSYTPYQAEISQGRMEALLNFQTMVMDLTGLPMANSSLLDEGTAAAEAMSLCHAASKNKRANKFFVDQNIFPQTLAVLKTRANPVGIEIVVGDEMNFQPSQVFFGCLIQYPGANGVVKDHSALFAKCHAVNVLGVVITDLLSLCLLKTPGEMGADVAVGSTQRFGVPMGFGGPHAAYMVTRDEFKRLLPGRIIGVSKDSYGHPALRLALQTREQHIRREKATSNICTAQVLLAVMSSMYAVYHGPKGLTRIAEQVHGNALRFADSLKKGGFSISSKNFFDTFWVETADAAKILARGRKENINLGHPTHGTLAISFDETTSEDDLEKLAGVFGVELGQKIKPEVKPANLLLRESAFLTHPVFNQYHSETEMLRYITRLQSKDLSLAHSMIPLGSCTMKLNATTEMIPVTWPEFSDLHPFAPMEQAQGYLELIRELEKWLAEITGFAGVSVAPNAGSQGEYAGLLVIRKYHESRGDFDRHICLIPSSAHGTNPASAAMAGFEVVVTACDEHGNVDLNDLRVKAEMHKARLGALMITYPSTHGVFEESLKEICDVIHTNGGQVYMDGANMNALVGVCQPGKIGPDVSHLNLHKTFCIPHGGGGPGVGPIGVSAHLQAFLPTHSLVKESGPATGTTAVTSAPWGSASILPISWAYIAMMGAEGLRSATEVALLNANYIAKKLEKHFPVLFKGKGGFVAHECIIDVRSFKTTSGITVDDIAKRLMDYGFHAPTMSWPVAGTLMIEPTESESKEELDRFINAMTSIREEIREIEEGKMDRDDNVLKNAPHSYTHLLATEWTHPYSREKAAFPRAWVRERKFWVPIGRVDNVYGDKNLVCACLPIEAYQ